MCDVGAGCWSPMDSFFISQANNKALTIDLRSPTVPPALKDDMLNTFMPRAENLYIYTIVAPVQQLPKALPNPYLIHASDSNPMYVWVNAPGGRFLALFHGRIHIRIDYYVDQNIVNMQTLGMVVIDWPQGKKYLGFQLDMLEPAPPSRL